MTEKIKELEKWLIENPDHPDYCIVWQDKAQLEKEILRTQVKTKAI